MPSEALPWYVFATLSTSMEEHTGVRRRPSQRYRPTTPQYTFFFFPRQGMSMVSTPFAFG